VVTGCTGITSAWWKSVFVYGLHEDYFQALLKLKIVIGKYTQCNQPRQDHSLINEAVQGMAVVVAL
jgi:predicted HNH restriction endonuclease